MNYFDVNAISQSAIKRALKGKVTLEERDPSTFTIGTLVDNMLTDEEQLDNFVISQGSAPSGKKKDFGDILLARHTESIFNDEHITLEDAQDAYDQVGYKIKDAQHYLDDWLSNPWYITKKLAADGKTVVSQDEWDKAQLVASSLLTHENTAKFFTGNADYQCEIYFTIQILDKVFNCKAKLDLVFNEGLHIRPFDVKTTRRSTAHFYQDIIDYRYDIQAVFYQLALMALYPDAIVAPMQFIVESHVYPGLPMVYDIHSEVNRDKALNDIKKGLTLVSHYQDVGNDLDINLHESPIHIENLWEPELFSILQDRQISSLGLEKYCSPDVKISLSNSILVSRK